MADKKKSLVMRIEQINSEIESRNDFISFLKGIVFEQTPAEFIWATGVIIIWIGFGSAMLPVGVGILEEAGIIPLPWAQDVWHFGGFLHLCLIWYFIVELCLKAAAYIYRRRLEFERRMEKS